jgi:hypothetical protein
MPKALGNWDFRISNHQSTINYFGYGNNSLNNDELNGMDYNRVRIRMLKLIPQIKKNRLYGSTLLFQTSLSYDIEQTNNRFVAIPNSVNLRVLKSTICWSIKYSYENYDNPSLPTMEWDFNRWKLENKS